MPPIVKSIEQLRKELRTKERLVKRLQAKRNKVLAAVAKIDRRIAAISGAGLPGRGRGRKPAPGLGAGNGRRRRRRASGKPLVNYVHAVLKKAKGPMRVKDVASAVIKRGYKTHSKDFYGIVASTLRDKTKFARVGRGKYKPAA